jgi:hypothetical protein
MSPVVSRGLTVAAAVVLGFDGAALLGLGAWSRRALLALVGLVFCLAAGLVLLSWRWYRRRLDDIAATREALREDALDLRRFLRDE